MLIDWSNFTSDLTSNIEDILLVILILVVGLVLGRVSNKFIDFLVSRTGLVKLIMGTKAQETAKRTSFTFINLIKIIVRWTIYLIAINQAIEILGLESINTLTNNIVTYLPNVVVALLIVILGFIFADKVVFAIDEYLKETKMPSNRILSTCIRYFIYIISVIMALSQLRISTDVLLVVAGAFSFLAVLFIILGAKEIAINFFAGLQVMWYKSFKIGDEVQISNVQGVIEEIGILSTTIKSTKGDYIVIPNSKLANDILIKKKH